MKAIVECRINEMLCRQRAAFDVTNERRWLDEANKWQLKREAEIVALFEEGSAISSNGAFPPTARAH